MKQTITAITLSLTLASTTSFASTTDTDNHFLFGAVDTVEMQTLDMTEMSDTEGQFFGMMMAPMTSMASSMMSPFSSMAGQMMAPMVSQLASGATNGVASQLASGSLGQLLGGLLGLFRNGNSSQIGASLGAGAANLLKSALSGFISNLLGK